MCLYIIWYMCVEHAANNVIRRREIEDIVLAICSWRSTLFCVGYLSFFISLLLSVSLMLHSRLNRGSFYSVSLIRLLEQENCWFPTSTNESLHELLYQFILVDAITSRCLVKLQTIIWARILKWIVHITTHGIMKNWGNVKISWPKNAHQWLYSIVRIYFHKFDDVKFWVEIRFF